MRQEAWRKYSQQGITLVLPFLLMLPCAEQAFRPAALISAAGFFLPLRWQCSEPITPILQAGYDYLRHP
ncbi:MAG: hypothetical protein ACI83P_001061 [Janthinobacterium sp.]|jgi:hypothetical protein